MSSSGSIVRPEIIVIRSGVKRDAATSAAQHVIHRTPNYTVDAPLTHEPRLLTCWKEIAVYMGKGVRTVQRWERQLNLPVRRPDSARHVVIALTTDIDDWVHRVHCGGQSPRVRLFALFSELNSLVRNSPMLRHEAVKLAAELASPQSVAEPLPFAPAIATSVSKRTNKA